LKVTLYYFNDQLYVKIVYKFVDVYNNVTYLILYLCTFTWIIYGQHISNYLLLYGSFITQFGTMSVYYFEYCRRDFGIIISWKHL